MKINLLVVLIVLLSGIYNNSYCDKPSKIRKNLRIDTLSVAPNDWFQLDAKQDNIRGISLDRAYSEFLNQKKSKTVIVAIIDSGIDVEHEDLKNNIWINEDEIAGNGIDDDKNGYVDDINGWSFLGNNKGENVQYDTYELTRQYVMYKKKFGLIKEKDIKKEDKSEYNKYLVVRKEYVEKLKEAQENYAGYTNLMEVIVGANNTLKTFLATDTLIKDSVYAIKTEDQKIVKAKAIFDYVDANKINEEQLKKSSNYWEVKVKYHLNENYESRNIVGDKYSDFENKFYGNNDVEGPDADHGTHVAGIVAAVRNNNVGMNGIADNVKIMAIRAVPDGDERDKDIANAVYYAVNNGARIINMSFGKSYSPDKEIVDKAFKYAESKGVLLIHAAGNDSENNDLGGNFPNKKFINQKLQINAWIEVGASSWGDTKNFVGSFSNYGKKMVDVFAPGVDIFSTIPDNKYDSFDGTSMASPVVTGTAALLLSYYPNLSAIDIKDILLTSSAKYEKLKVNKPAERGEKQKMIKFKKLCASGGIVNAYEAVKLAENKSQNTKL